MSLSQALAYPQPLLGTFFFVRLPSAGNYPLGTPAYTVDQGLVYSNGTSWQSMPTVFAFGSSNLPGYANIIVPPGEIDNLNPTNGFPTGISRLDIQPAAGNANITGLLAGVDGQELLIGNPDSANNLTLNNQNTNSLSANRFWGSADFELVPGGNIWAVYQGRSINRWRLVP